ncbi:MAG: UvrD-helicase domain-containing protein [Thermoleophilia bacterium]|nr:UvrD-helicase domain-containing protein [Thermoleophilia bacterium]
MNLVKSMRLSDLQAAAVLDGSPRVLISAGAGSGKTRLLVARVVHALLEEDLPMDRLIAVTFTRKAGAELSARIASSLEACGRSDLARALDTATTGTIHSLCLRLVREHSLEAGVDPGCGVLEAEAAVLLQQEASGRAWESVVETAGEAQLSVLARQGERLRREMLSLYERLRGMGQEEPRLQIRPGPDDMGAREALVDALRAALDAGSATPKRSRTLEQDLAKVSACLAWLEGEAAESDSEEALRRSEDFFPSRRTASMEPYFVPVRVALTRYRAQLAQAPLILLVAVMNRLLQEFHGEYSVRKAERGVLDFADLELRARALLKNAAAEGAACAPTLAGALLLVDEFQDTNALQCEILEGLRAARMVMVGDERQSIYRFRGADVDVFRARQAALGAGAPAGGATPVHRLDVNYRSDPRLLAFINRVFSHPVHFGEGFVPLQSDPERGAHVAVPGGAPAVEVLVTERTNGTETDTRTLSMQHSEAAVVAERVRSLVEDEGWRQRDVVVLLPAQTHVEVYQEEIRAWGVDVYVVRGRGYYAREEVTDVIALLQLLVNPHDDLALVSVLRSPMVGISDDTLYHLGRRRQATRARSLWTVVREPGDGPVFSDESAADGLRLAQFRERVAEVRTRVGRPGLSRLIDDAISAFRYDLCLLAAPEGRRRFANVRKLMRLADEFEALNGPDPAGLVELFRSVGNLSDREGSAPTLAEGEDVVRVMTVHQAKGLEFPVVVLAGLGSDLSRTDSPAFVVSNDGRTGVFMRDSKHKTYEAYDLCLGPAIEIEEEQRKKEREEDTRLLYVAMTRAQHRLVLVGARPKGDECTANRIGRVVTALGQAGLPETGAPANLHELQTVVAAVAPAPYDAEISTPPRRRTVSATSTMDTRPRLLEIRTPGRAVRRISFSALAAYGRCPRQYYLERTLGLSLSAVGPFAAGGSGGGGGGAGRGAGGLSRSHDDDQEVPVAYGEDVLDDVEWSTGRDVGLLVHALLEGLPHRGGRPHPAAVRETAQRARSAMSLELNDADLDRAVTLAMGFWDSPAAPVWSAPSARREVPFFFSQGSTVVSGVMDLLERRDDVWRIVDYKTNALHGRSPLEVAGSYSLQAAVYCLAALRAGAPSVRMDLVFLERPAEPVSEGHSRDDIPVLEAELAEALEGLRQRRFPTRRGEICDRCAVAEVCAAMAAGGSDGIE